MEMVSAEMALSESSDAGDVPMLLVARTEQVYVLPVVRLATSRGLPDPDALRVVPPSVEEHVTVKEVIGLPLAAPGVKATDRRFGDGTVTDVIAGRPGTAAGVTASESTEDEPIPAAFEARTVKVYEVPLASPVTVQLVTGVTGLIELVEQVAPPGVAVTS